MPSWPKPAMPIESEAETVAVNMMEKILGPEALSETDTPKNPVNFNGRHHHTVVDGNISWGG